MPEQTPITVETLKAITAAFNAHDLDHVVEFMAEDCSFDMPRGPDSWGRRYMGKAAAREGLASRLKGLPDVHYSDDRHWVSANKGVSEWAPDRHDPRRRPRTRTGVRPLGSVETGRSSGRIRTGRLWRSKATALTPGVHSMTRILLALVLSLGLLLAFVPLVAETQPPGKTAGSGCSRPAAASSRHARYFILQLVEAT